MMVSGKPKPNFSQADYAGYANTLLRGKDNYQQYPRTVSIETLVKCNAKCGFCPYPNSTRQGQEMTPELFMKLLDDLSGIPPNHSFVITLCRLNEPLLDARLQVFHGKIASRFPNATILFWSNGTTLKKGAFEWMSDFQRAALIISLNSVDEEEHMALMGFGLKVVNQNLDHLHGLVEQQQFKLPVKLSAPYHDDPQAEKFTKACKERWPKFGTAVRPYFQWMGESAAGLEYKTEAGLPGKYGETSDAEQIPCGQWFDIHVLANGYVTKCCIDETGYQGQERFNAAQRNLLSIYRERDNLKSTLPARVEVLACKGCTHLG